MWRERLACSVVVIFRGMEANTDPSTPALPREVEARSDPPTPLKFPGREVLLSSVLRQLLGPERGGFHSSALSVLVTLSYGCL